MYPKSCKLTDELLFLCENIFFFYLFIFCFYLDPYFCSVHTLSQKVKCSCVYSPRSKTINLNTEN